MLILLHTAIAIIATVLLILVFRISPIIALVVGALYLGLAAGLGLENTAQAIAQGFGNVMAEIGLVIGFGLLMGSLLITMGALQKLADALLRTFSSGKLPYVSSISLSTIFPSIFGDVLVVLVAPLARSIAPRLGQNGMATMGATVTCGLLAGTGFVLPGVAPLVLAGFLGVPLGLILIYGLLVAIPTVVLTMFVYGWFLNHGLWNRDKDEEVRFEAVPEGNAAISEQETNAAMAGTGGREAPPSGNAAILEQETNTAMPEQETEQFPPLYVSLLPLVLALVLIAAGAIINDVAGLESSTIAFFSDPVIALFLSFTFAYLLAWRTVSHEQAGNAVSGALNQVGQILIITGVGGSLAAVIGETDLENTLSGFFSAGALSPLLLAWLVAALLHVAVGSVTTASIAAASILAPIVGDLEVSTVFIALAACSGALFCEHVNSNFFWLFRTVMGFTTQGALKTYTLPISMLSVISLPLILVLSFVFS